MGARGMREAGEKRVRGKRNRGKLLNNASYWQSKKN